MNEVIQTPNDFRRPKAPLHPAQGKNLEMIYSGGWGVLVFVPFLAFCFLRLKCQKGDIVGGGARAWQQQNRFYSISIMGGGTARRRRAEAAPQRLQ